MRFSSLWRSFGAPTKPTRDRGRVRKARRLAPQAANVALDLEPLERRDLFAVIPAVISTDHLDLSSAGTFDDLTDFPFAPPAGNFSTPSVAIDPTDPLRMV